MPNRVVREGILDSERVNKLTWAGEVFYRRLMSIVDDFGRYEGRADLIRSKTYPIRIDKVSVADVEKWMRECADAGLVSLYSVNQKPYLEVLNFNQTVRIKRSKYPPPEYSAKHVQSSAIHMQADDKQMLSESNPIQSETNANPDYTRPRDFIKTVNEIEFEQIQLKSTLAADEYEKCLEQWSLSIEGSDFKYSNSKTDDYRKLTSLLKKWINSWVDNNRKSGKQPNNTPGGGSFKSNAI